MTDEEKEATGQVVPAGELSEVIDVKTDKDVVDGWYNEAMEVRDAEGLQKLLERVLGNFQYTPATTPHAFAAIALAALKMANESKHGKLDEGQWKEVVGLLTAAMTGE
jgi:hypothetical protein